MQIRLAGGLQVGNFSTTCQPKLHYAVYQLDVISNSRFWNNYLYLTICILDECNLG